MKYTLLLFCLFLFGASSNAQCYSTHFDDLPNSYLGSYPASWMNFTGTTSATFEMWVKRQSISNPTTKETIFSKVNCFDLSVTHDTLTGTVGNSSVRYKYPSDSNWHHVAFIRDRSLGQLRLYIDGTLVQTATDYSSSVTSTYGIAIGAVHTGIDDWRGNLCIFRVSLSVRYTGNFTPDAFVPFDNDAYFFCSMAEGVDSTQQILRLTNTSTQYSYYNYVLSGLHPTPDAPFSGYVNISTNVLVSTCQDSVIFSTTNTVYNTNDLIYHWYYNDVLIPGGTDSFLIAKQTGNYKVEVQNNIGGPFCTYISSNVYVKINPKPVIHQTGIIDLSTDSFASYQWKLNGINVNGATNRNYTPVANGNYTVVIIDSNGCSGTSDPVAINKVGIESITNEEFVVYPTVARDFIYIKSKEDCAVTITDNLGRVVKRSKEKTIAVSDLPTGIFFVYVKSATREKKQRILVQR